MLTYFLMFVAALLYLALAYFLVRKYIYTHNKGFVWLGIAFLVWPFVQNLLGIYKRHLLNRFIEGQYPSWFQLNISAGTFMQAFQLAEFTVLPALLLIALYYLGNPKFEKRELLT